MNSSTLLSPVSFPINGKCLYEDALKNSTILSTGSQSLDDLLDGGLWTNELLEIAGPPGSGKTQMCLTAAAKVVAESGNNSVFYIDTNGSFVCERMIEIIAERKGPCFPQFLQNALSNVKYFRVFDALSLLSALKNLESKLVDQAELFYCELRLVILDSITPLISPILGGGQTQGHMLMMEIGRTLKRLSVEYNLATIVVNNVVLDWDSAAKTQYKPALGKSWKLVPHSRIHFEVVDSRASSYRAVLTKSNKKETGNSAVFGITEKGLV